ncbi:MAG: DUF3806 domain-containing protein [Candidatus Acidiferrales bacterium]
MIKVLLAVMLFGPLGLSKQETPHPAAPRFDDLSQADMTRLDRQRAIIAAAVKQRYGVPTLKKNASDLTVLQRLIDDKAFAKTQTYELQSLGVAFGDVLAGELPLRWVMVTDEYGTDPTLRFKSTTLQINALTMISKRVERGESVDLDELLQKTHEYLRRFSKTGTM